MRGGYQITYNGLPSFNSLTQTQVDARQHARCELSGDSGANAYLDLTKLPSLVPAQLRCYPCSPCLSQTGHSRFIFRHPTW